MNKKYGFTLVELIVVLAIIAALVGILIAVVKPQQIFARLRDTQRSSDLNNLSRAIDVYLTEFAQSAGSITLAGSNNERCRNGTASFTVYYSVPMNATLTLDGINAVATGNTSTKADGTGWLPINFTQSKMIQLSQLPLDPRNSTSSHYYYTYACEKNNFAYELNARLEVMSDLAANDGGNAPDLLELGPDKTILPASTTGFYK